MARSFGRAFANKLASEIIKERNRKKRAIVQSEQKRIRERPRAIVKRERQATIKKSQKARYVVNRKNEANRKTDAVLAYFDIYYKIFHEALRNNNYFQFKHYKKPFVPNSFTYEKPYPQNLSPALEIVPKESWLEKIITFKKKLSIINSNELKIKECEIKFKEAVFNYNWQKDEAHSVWLENERLREESTDNHNIKIDEWEKANLNGQEKAVSLIAKELLRSNDYDINVITQYN